MTLSDFFLYKLERLIFRCDLEFFASYFLFTNRIVTVIELCVAIPMIHGFNDDCIAFGKEFHGTLSPPAELPCHVSVG